ncbi:MAG: CAP domain-containing protein [Deltaproteobacteria bacterium]|nr:CAP domain-containing protein [Deltaproteobacteria bacterium]
MSSKSGTPDFVPRCQPVFFLLLCVGLACWGSLAFTLPCLANETSLTALEREVHALVNEHRQDLGLRPLAYDGEIARHARRHSQEMAGGRGSVDHDGAEERRAALSRRMEFNGFAENVAMNNSATSRTAEVTVRGWLKSAGHRRNMEGDFTLTGIGVARSDTGSYFFTQIFLRAPDTRAPRTKSRRFSEPPSSVEPDDDSETDLEPSRNTFDPRHRAGRKRGRDGWIQELPAKR